MGKKEAFELLDGIDVIIATKGRSVVTLDLRRDAPDEATVAGLLIGPTGNLRAPTHRVGRTLLVGFDPDAYARVLA